MSVITLFSGAFCQEESVIQELKTRAVHRLVTEKEIVARASALSGMTEEAIAGAFKARVSIFNRFTHERERAVAYLRMAMADALADDHLLISGFTGLLIPKAVSHALAVCLISEMADRVRNCKNGSRFRRRMRFPPFENAMRTRLPGCGWYAIKRNPGTVPLTTS